MTPLARENFHWHHEGDSSVSLERLSGHSPRLLAIVREASSKSVGIVPGDKEQPQAPYGAGRIFHSQACRHPNTVPSTCLFFQNLTSQQWFGFNSLHSHKKCKTLPERDEDPANYHQPVWPAGLQLQSADHMHRRLSTEGWAGCTGGEGLVGLRALTSLWAQGSCKGAARALVLSRDSKGQQVEGQTAAGASPCHSAHTLLLLTWPGPSRALRLLSSFSAQQEDQDRGSFLAQHLHWLAKWWPEEGRPFRGPRSWSVSTMSSLTIVCQGTSGPRGWQKVGECCVTCGGWMKPRCCSGRAARGCQCFLLTKQISCSTSFPANNCPASAANTSLSLS